jgi:hypothetical protein
MLAGKSHTTVIVGTEFTGRTFTNNVVTVNDYTLNGVSSPGTLTFTNVPSGTPSFMTSTDATGFAAPKRNPPNWKVQIAVNVGSQAIELTDVTVALHSFNNGEETKTGINGGDFAPNHQPTVRLLDSSQSTIDSETQDAWAVNGNNQVAAWTGVFTFVSDDTLAANTNYFIEIEMTGSSGNNVGIDSLAINGELVPEPSSLALLALGGLAMARRRRS